MIEAIVTTRAALVAEALDWIGTPYHHQASVKGIGCDCLGLVRGLYRFVHGREAERPPAYTPDWAEAAGREVLLEAAGRWLAAAPGGPESSDVLIFRMLAGAPAKHCGVLVNPDQFVHAVSGRGVARADYSHWWRRRTVGVFSLVSSADG